MHSIACQVSSSQLSEQLLIICHVKSNILPGHHLNSFQPANSSKFILSQWSQLYRAAFDLHLCFSLGIISAHKFIKSSRSSFWSQLHEASFDLSSEFIKSSRSSFWSQLHKVSFDLSSEFFINPYKFSYGVFSASNSSAIMLSFQYYLLGSLVACLYGQQGQPFLSPCIVKPKVFICQ